MLRTGSDECEVLMVDGGSIRWLSLLRGRELCCRKEDEDALLECMSELRLHDIGPLGLLPKDMMDDSRAQELFISEIARSSLANYLHQYGDSIK